MWVTITTVVWVTSPSRAWRLLCWNSWLFTWALQMWDEWLLDIREPNIHDSDRDYKGWDIAQNSSFLTLWTQPWFNPHCHRGKCKTCLCAENPLIASPPTIFSQPQIVLLLFFKCSKVCVVGREQLLESVSSFHHAMWVPGIELRSGVKLEMLSHLTDVFNLYIFLNCPLWRKVWGLGLSLSHFWPLDV